MRGFILFIASSLLLVPVVADVIECDNGDKYNGKVLSMDEKTVKLQNEITGVLTIPRNRIVGISFRPGQSPSTAKASTNSPAVNANGRVKIDSGSVERVQNELLATATPEANQMFQEMIRGLQSGQLNVGDIRAQAQTTLKELREAQKDLGDEELAGLLNTYGAILENFLRQTPPTAGTTLRPPPVKATTREESEE